MKLNTLKHVFIFFMLFQKGYALTSSDVNVKLISGYFWFDNACSLAAPKGKVVSFRIINTKGTTLQGVKVTLGTISFTRSGAVTYTSGTPSFTCRTPVTVYIGNIAAGDSATAFFFVGYNCLIYPNGTAIATDYTTLPLTLTDVNPGSVFLNFTKNPYVLQNANNNTITVLATTSNLVGNILTISVAYNISNVKPTNIIDMELNATAVFPAGYSISGCKITSSTVPVDFPVNLKNTHYCNSVISNMPSGGLVTIEWSLKISAAITGISASNIKPYVVSDAGSAQRWQVNTAIYRGTSIPTNTLVISKRVNNKQVMSNDTVIYTIVLKNTSLLYDIVIDQLVDNLPRDYKFLHMETNTAVFPRLVTYSNCTVYPVCQDTNFLDFYGQKEMSPGVFSWVIPKNDSVKLIYSSQVSPTGIGLNDTNFISAFVGSSKVGTAFAIVNINSPLPLGVLNFNAEKEGNDVELTWMAADANGFSYFNIYRQSPGSEDFVKIGKVRNGGEYNQVDYTFTDYMDFGVNPGFMVYKLEQVSYEGASESYLAYLDLTTKGKDIKIIRVESGYIGIGNLNDQIKNVNVMVHDIMGRTLYSGNIDKIDSLCRLPYNFSRETGSCVFLTVEMAGGTITKKVLIE